MLVCLKLGEWCLAPSGSPSFVSWRSSIMQVGNPSLFLLFCAKNKQKSVKLWLLKSVFCCFWGLLLKKSSWLSESKLLLVKSSTLVNTPSAKTSIGWEVIINFHFELGALKWKSPLFQRILGILRAIFDDYVEQAWLYICFIYRFSSALKAVEKNQCFCLLFFLFIDNKRTKQRRRLPTSRSKARKTTGRHNNQGGMWTVWSPQPGASTSRPTNTRTNRRQPSLLLKFNYYPFYLILIIGNYLTINEVVKLASTWRRIRQIFENYYSFYEREWRALFTSNLEIYRNLLLSSKSLDREEAKIQPFFLLKSNSSKQWKKLIMTGLSLRSQWKSPQNLMDLGVDSETMSFLGSTLIEVLKSPDLSVPALIKEDNWVEFNSSYQQFIYEYLFRQQELQSGWKPKVVFYLSDRRRRDISWKATWN